MLIICKLNYALSVGTGLKTAFCYLHVLSFVTDQFGLLRYNFQSHVCLPFVILS